MLGTSCLPTAGLAGDAQPAVFSASQPDCPAHCSHGYESSCPWEQLWEHVGPQHSQNLLNEYPVTTWILLPAL